MTDCWAHPQNQDMTTLGRGLITASRYFDGADPGAVTTSGGVFGCFRYVPSRNVFARANDVDENVFVLRMAAGTGTLLPTPPDGSVSGSGGAAGSGGGSSGGGGASSGGAGAANDDDGGCGCSAPARAPGAWLLSLAALSVLWAFRRRWT